MPGSMGPKPSLQKPFVHQESAPQVRPWKAPGAKHAGAPGVRARKLDGRLDALAAGAGKEHLVEAAAGARAQRWPRAPASSGHGSATSPDRAVQFFLQRADDVRMIVPGVVDAIARQEIEDNAAIRGVQASTPSQRVVANIHLRTSSSLTHWGLTCRRRDLHPRRRGVRLEALISSTAET